MPEPHILLTPGPTPLPPSVYDKLSEPILHHRTGEFSEIFGKLAEGLKAVYRTKNPVLVAASSGTGAMESSVSNLLSPGDRILIHTTCVFGQRFVKIARAYGLDPVVLEEEFGRAADPDRLRAALKDNPGIKAVFHQHVSTPTAVVNDIRSLAVVVRENSDALTVVDAVSGLAGEELDTDAWGLDAVVSASHKGLMNPPGLSFVSVSDRAWKAVETSRFPRFYFDWRAMRDKLPAQQTPFTPAVTLVAAQAEAVRMILEEGLENVWARTRELAEFTRTKAGALGLELFAKAPADVATALKVPEGVDGKKLVKDMRVEDRISIAGGQQKLQGKIIRIAHMGYIRKPDIEAGFEALSRRLGLGSATKAG